MGFRSSFFNGYNSVLVAPDVRHLSLSVTPRAVALSCRICTARTEHAFLSRQFLISPSVVGASAFPNSLSTSSPVLSGCVVCPHWVSGTLPGAHGIDIGDCTPLYGIFSSMTYTNNSIHELSFLFLVSLSNF